MTNSILSHAQMEARSKLKIIGWRWDHETIRSGVLTLKIYPKPNERVEFRQKGYSLKPGTVVAEILMDGRVKMGEVV